MSTMRCGLLCKPRRAMPLCLCTCCSPSGECLSPPSFLISPRLSVSDNIFPGKLSYLVLESRICLLHEAFLYGPQAQRWMTYTLFGAITLLGQVIDFACWDGLLICSSCLPRSSHRPWLRQLPTECTERHWVSGCGPHSEGPRSFSWAPYPLNFPQPMRLDAVVHVTAYVFSFSKPSTCVSKGPVVSLDLASTYKVHIRG